MSVTVSCPSAGCSNNHTVLANNSGYDRAETLHKDCDNRIITKTRDGKVVAHREVCCPSNRLFIFDEGDKLHQCIYWDRRYDR